MNKKEIIAYFDRCAPQWDARMVTDDGKINGILDAAGVREHDVVLDVACGTGVLFGISRSPKSKFAMQSTKKNLWS